MGKARRTCVLWDSWLAGWLTACGILLQSHVTGAISKLVGCYHIIPHAEGRSVSKRAGQGMLQPEHVVRRARADGMCSAPEALQG